MWLILIAVLVGFLVLLALQPKFLWWVYGYCYDGLRDFYPYQVLIQQVISAADPKAKQSVLDIGCGTGNAALALEELRRPMEYTGFDGSSTMLRMARRKAKQFRYVSATFSQADVLDFVLAEHRQFDHILISNVLYTVTDRPAFFRALHKLLAPGGIIVITNPDRPGSKVITAEHIRKRGRLSLLRPRLLAVGVIDALISLASRGQAYDFTPYKKLAAEAEQAGFSSKYLRRTYGGERQGVNILFTLKRK